MRLDWFLMSALTLASDNPQELGDVEWGRDLDAAFEVSKGSGKPVFVQFQEIPGCATCRNYGDGPLSHPLIVEAIETEFVPVAVYNNKEGEDARILKRFSEPSWNNPVMRILNADGRDVLPRRDGIYSTAAVSERLVDALEAAERDVPEYLELVELEERADRLPTAVFAMHCFWQGEARLGSVDGVASTRCGFYDGREVVEVRFDPRATSLEKLIERARELQCASAVYVPKDLQKDATGVADVQILDGAVRPAPESDQRYQQRRSLLRYLPMSDLQSVRINAALGAREPSASYLSPLQQSLFKKLKGLQAEDAGKLSTLREFPGLDALKETAESLGL